MLRTTGVGLAELRARDIWGEGAAEILPDAGVVLKFPCERAVGVGFVGAGDGVSEKKAAEHRRRNAANIAVAIEDQTAETGGVLGKRKVRVQRVAVLRPETIKRE